MNENLNANVSRTQCVSTNDKINQSKNYNLKLHALFVYLDEFHTLINNLIQLISLNFIISRIGPHFIFDDIAMLLRSKNMLHCYIIIYKICVRQSVTENDFGVKKILVFFVSNISQIDGFASH